MARSAGLAAIGVAVVLVAAFVVLRGGNGTPAANDVPPSGIVWFGSGLAPGSGVLTGPVTSVGLGKPVAIVAHLARPSRGEDFSIAVNIDGVPISEPGPHLDSGAEILGLQMPGLWVFQAGTMTVRVLDASGTTLALGSIAVTP